MMAEDEVPKAHLARHVADQRGQYLQIASVPGQLCKMMRIREPTHLVPRNQYSPSSSRHQRAIMTKTLKINHERMQHAPAIVIDGAPVLSSRSEEHTSELQSLMRISYAVFCLKQKISFYSFSL